MSWGKLTTEQEHVLRKYINGRDVLDVGSGDGVLSLTLARLGAHRVLAVDKEDYVAPPKHPDSITYKLGMFLTSLGADETLGHDLFVSWPPSTYVIEGLFEVPTTWSIGQRLIYLGVNYNGSVCGSRDFWRALSTRQILACVTGPHTMIIYDMMVPRRDTELMPEETNELNEEIHSYDEYLAKIPRTYRGRE